MMRRRIGVGLCLLLVVGAVSYGLSRIGAGARAERGVPPARKATVATEPAARPVVFQMAPAPWTLPSPLSRAVALSAGNRIRLFGGLGPANSTTGAVVDVDPATGREAPVGSLVDPVHDAAGAVIGGGQVVFGGGSSTVVAAVQSLGDQQGSAVTRRGALPAPRADLAYSDRRWQGHPGRRTMGLPSARTCWLRPTEPASRSWPNFRSLSAIRLSRRLEGWCMSSAASFPATRVTRPPSRSSTCPLARRRSPPVSRLACHMPVPP